MTIQVQQAKRCGRRRSTTHVPCMTSRSAAPRDHAATPDLFGLADSIRWKTVGSDDLTGRAELLAAKWQHDVAVQIRRHATDHHSSIEAYSAATGQSHRRIAAVLNGTTPMRLDDLAAAAHHLGVQLGTVKNEA